MREHTHTHTHTRTHARTHAHTHTHTHTHTHKHKHTKQRHFFALRNLYYRLLLLEYLSSGGIQLVCSWSSGCGSRLLQCVCQWPSVWPARPLQAEDVDAARLASRHEPHQRHGRSTHRRHYKVGRLTASRTNEHAQYKHCTWHPNNNR